MTIAIVTLIYYVTQIALVLRVGAALRAAVAEAR